MDGSNTSAAQPSASETSPTTLPDPCSNPADLDVRYTVVREEPLTASRSPGVSFPALALPAEQTSRTIRLRLSFAGMRSASG